MSKKLVIAISGPPGTGTTTISKQLAKELNLDYFSTGKIFKSKYKGKEAECALKAWRSELGKSKNHHEYLDKLQLEKAKKENAVICGKLSVYILKDIAKFKIWIESPLEVRAKRVVVRDKIPFDEALNLIQERERVEREEWKKIYGIDYFESKNLADIVIDNSNKTVKETVKEILYFIKRKL